MLASQRCLAPSTKTPPCVWSRQAPTPSQKGEPHSPTTARTRQRKAPRPQSQRRRYRPPHRSCSGALAPLRPVLPSGGKWTPSIPLNYRTLCENHYPLTAAPPTKPIGWRLQHRACRSPLVRMVNICPHCGQPSQNRRDVKGQSVQRTSETYSQKRRAAPPRRRVRQVEQVGRDDLKCGARSDGPLFLNGLRAGGTPTPDPAPRFPPK